MSTAVPGEEFDCCECGRHIIIVCGGIPEPPLCAACMMMPGWFSNPEVRAILDPDHDGRDRSVAAEVPS